MNLHTTAEVAAQFRCTPRKVRTLAAKLGLGAHLGGAAGWRYTDADVAAMWESLRPVQPVARKRRRAS